MKVVEKAMDVLQLMANNPNRRFWRITDISNELDMSVSTTHRIAKSLKDSGVLNQDNGTKQYCLGTNFIYYGGIVREMNIPGIIIYPLMQRLYDELLETVFITIQDRDSCVVVERINSFHQLQFVKYIGETHKLYEGACGKVILAYLPDEIQEKVLDRIKKEYEFDIDQLKGTLEKIKQDRYYVEDVPSMDSTTFSTPVFSIKGNYLASLSTIIPKCRLTDEIKERVIDVLLTLVNEFMAEGHF